MLKFRSRSNPDISYEAEDFKSLMEAIRADGTEENLFFWESIRNRFRIVPWSYGPDDFARDFNAFFDEDFELSKDGGLTYNLTKGDKNNARRSKNK